jgi:hypothetical protein
MHARGIASFGCGLHGDDMRSSRIDATLTVTSMQNYPTTPRNFPSSCALWFM